MFSFLWERLSKKQRRRALRSAVILCVCAYLLLALVGEPLQPKKADLLKNETSFASSAIVNPW